MLLGVDISPLIINYHTEERCNSSISSVVSSSRLPRGLIGFGVRVRVRVRVRARKSRLANLSHAQAHALPPAIIMRMTHTRSRIALLGFYADDDDDGGGGGCRSRQNRRHVLRCTVLSDSDPQHMWSARLPFSTPSDSRAPNLPNRLMNFEHGS